MRIIGGQARGRSIIAPPGEKTRPTQDYVRESLFNIIRWEIADARVLDLFAGTGALSLEAVSRGAHSAVMIDMDRAACACIKKNMLTTKLEAQCRLIERDYKAAIAQLAREGAVFDVVFIDPPYRMDNTGEMCAQLADSGLLSPECLLLVEHKRGMAPLADPRFEAADQRNYGETQITFLRLRRREEENKSDEDAVPGEL